MRRAIEVLVLAVFLGIGVAAVTGNLPLPHLDIDSSSLGPIEATSEPASGCASCTADCPLAGGGSQDDTANGDTPGTGEAIAVDPVPVHADLSNSDELPEAIAEATGLPLSGGVITETPRGVADGQSRVWVDIATSSPVEDATQWYRDNLSEAGWELRDDQPDVVPNGEFLSFERDGITLNVLFETTERHTRIFVDYPQEEE